MAHVDPTLVIAALNKLEANMPNGQMPTADLVRMVIKLILSQKELDALKTKVTLTTEKLNLMTELYQQMSSNPSTPPATNMERREAENLVAHLTAEELAHLRTMVAERTPTSPSSLDTNVELIPGPTDPVVPKAFQPPRH